MTPSSPRGSTRRAATANQSGILANNAQTGYTGLTGYGMTFGVNYRGIDNFNLTLGQGNDNLFVRKAKHTLTSQGEIQDNGFSYDVTMWYDNTDIYVAFHCYHAG